MARKRYAPGLAEDSPKLDISSMIDATFLLLIYFLITTTILPREQDITMALPGRTTLDTPVKLDPKIITIEGNGTIFTGAKANRIPMDTDPNLRNVPKLLAELNHYYHTARAIGSTPLVQIHADNDASHQRVLDVINALTKTGITHVTFTDTPH